MYELDPDHLWPEYWEHVALLRAAQWRSIRNCYEQDEGYRKALEEELAYVGLTPKQFFDRHSWGGELDVTRACCLPSSATTY